MKAIEEVAPLDHKRKADCVCAREEKGGTILVGGVIPTGTVNARKSCTAHRENSRHVGFVVLVWGLSHDLG